MTKTVGLRTEILVTLTLLLGAALLLGGLMMLRLMEKSLLEERVGQLESLTHILAQSMLVQGAGPGNRLSQQQNKRLLQQLPGTVNCDAWWLYSRDLLLVDSYAVRQGTPFPASRRQMVKLSGEQQRRIDFPTLLNFNDKTEPSVHFIVPIEDKGRFYGLLELHYSLDDIRLNLLKSQQLIVIYVFLYGAVLILVGYYLLQRNIIKPARNLLKATVDVSCGNLETRVPITGPAEISQLSVAYNKMAEALRSSHSDTEKHIRSLEETNLELQRTRDELIRSEKMASVGQLVAGLAHELGNPLAALVGYLELLQQKNELSSRVDIVKRSLVEAARIDFLVRELLEFSRPDENGQNIDVDLVVELNACVQLLNNQGAIPSVRIDNKLPRTLPVVIMNRSRLQQVFVNLLLNAGHACGQNGRITLTAGIERDGVWAAITDNGAGIATSDLLRIFDPFFTTKDPGEGTGLGLAICQRIISERQGMIEVQSTLGAGSQFRVVLPINTHPESA